MPSDDSAPCTVSDGSSSWDLSPLSVKGEDWVYSTPDGNDFHLHVCAPVHAELWNPLPVGTPVDDVTAFVRTPSGDRSIGSMTYSLSVSDTDPPAPVLKLSGPACAAVPGQLTETTVRFVCSPHAEGGPVLISSWPSSGAADQACAYQFEWATASACPSSGVLDGILGDKGAVALFVGMVAVVGFAWLVGTLLYRRFILKLSGRELLPALPTFKRPALPSLGSCWPGRSAARKPWKSFRSNSYSRISTTADEEDGLVGRFGLDSDDDDDEGEGEGDAHPLEGDSRVWRSGAGAGAAGEGAGAAAAKGGNGLISL